MTKVLHGDGHGVSDVTCRVAGSINIEDADRVSECLKWETQPFCDQSVNEGGVSSAIQQHGNGVIVLSASYGNSYINEEFALLVDPAGIDGFRDLVSNRRKNNRRFLVMGFVDGMKHSIRATAVLWTS